MSKRLWWSLFAAIALLLLPLGITSAKADGTPTPVPAPVLSIVKTPLSPVAEVGDLVGFTVTVVNSGNADTGAGGLVTMQDSLPPGLNWIVGANTFDECSITQGVLTCVAENIVRRHVNDAETDFENGSAYVDLWAVTNTCGVILNNAVVVYHGKVQNSGLRSIRVNCPATPTPTATPVPPTPTAVPPTEVPSTPVVIIKYVTPTAPTPRPPNTGDGSVAQASVAGDYGFYIAMGIVLSGFAGLVALRRLQR